MEANEQNEEAGMTVVVESVGELAGEGGREAKRIGLRCDAFNGPPSWSGGGHARGSGPRTVEDFVRMLLNRCVDTARMSVEDRHWYVEHLTQEGMAVSEMARLLGVSERTIVRDRTVLGKGVTVEPSLSLGDELLGQVQKLAFDVTQKLLKMAEDEKLPAYTRVRARAEAVKTQERLVHTLMKLGYLETGEWRMKRLMNARNKSARAEFVARGGSQVDF